LVAAEADDLGTAQATGEADEEHRAVAQAPRCAKCQASAESRRSIVATELPCRRPSRRWRRP
jgi:hypothetical protein